MAALTIKDIARICGVGTSTVSRAINDDPGINPETKERILTVVEEFHYVPNNSARNLKVTDSNTVGVLVKGRNNRFFQSMYADFEQELEQAGYDFTFKEIAYNENELLEAEAMIKEKRLKGIIFLGGMIENPDESLARLDVPYVLCTVAVNTRLAKSSSVGIDDEKESYKIVDYLIKKGHKRIAVIVGQRRDYAVGRRRMQGYVRALNDNGIIFDDSLVIYQRDDLPDYSEANGYAVMSEFLKSGKEFTAVYAIADLLALGAYKAIYDAGKKIPQDYSVMGFDGIEITKYMYPALTTVRQPIEKIVKESVDIIIKEISGDRTSRQVYFETELVEQDSVIEIL